MLRAAGEPPIAQAIFRRKVPPVEFVDIGAGRVGVDRAQGFAAFAHEVAEGIRVNEWVRGAGEWAFECLEVTG